MKVLIAAVLAVVLTTVGCSPEVPRRDDDHPASPQVDPAPVAPPTKTLNIDRDDLPRPAPEMTQKESM